MIVIVVSLVAFAVVLVCFDRVLGRPIYRQKRPGTLNAENRIAHPGQSVQDVVTVLSSDPLAHVVLHLVLNRRAIVEVRVVKAGEKVLHNLTGIDAESRSKAGSALAFEYLASCPSDTYLVSSQHLTTSLTVWRTMILAKLPAGSLRIIEKWS